MTLDQQLEAILFATARPMTMKKLAEITENDVSEIKTATDALRKRLEDAGCAVMLQSNGQNVELVTRPETAETVAKVIQDEAAGELTRPSLETLTILAYCGPLTRPEIEQIRGVQSSLILRNLMLRGLVEEREESRLGQATYAVTLAFLNHLGLPSVDALPDYAELRGNAAIADVLTSLEQPAPAESTPTLPV